MLDVTNIMISGLTNLSKLNSVQGSVESIKDEVKLKNVFEMV